MKKQFHNIAKITLVLTYLVIIAGAVVRMTGSGMGCPDWPKCFGYYIPPTERIQLEWHENHNYKKGQVIIVDETLQVAKNNFTSTQNFSKDNWKTYTKHDYAIFNPTHTWVEYINRLCGALAGLATLVMFFASISYWKKSKIITLLSLFTVFAMGFQAWLGKTVVDSNLAPLKITIHMVMAFVIVAIMLYVIFKTRYQVKPFKYNKTFHITLIVSLALTCIQTVLGTQVRQFIDEQMKLLGDTRKALWLSDPTIVFYIHRSFSILVVLISLYLLFLHKKQQLNFNKIYWILSIIAIEVVSGIAMANFNFPFGSQSIHLVLASILFGLQFYIILESKSAKS